MNHYLRLLSSPLIGTSLAYFKLPTIQQYVFSFTIFIGILRLIQVLVVVAGAALSARASVDAQERAGVREVCTLTCHSSQVTDITQVIYKAHGSSVVRVACHDHTLYSYPASPSYPGTPRSRCPPGHEAHAHEDDDDESEMWNQLDEVDEEDQGFSLENAEDIRSRWISTSYMAGMTSKLR